MCVCAFLCVRVYVYMCVHVCIYCIFVCCVCVCTVCVCVCVLNIFVYNSFTSLYDY